MNERPGFRVNICFSSINLDNIDQDMWSVVCIWMQISFKRFCKIISFLNRPLENTHMDQFINIVPESSWHITNKLRQAEIWYARITTGKHTTTMMIIIFWETIIIKIFFADIPYYIWYYHRLHSIWTSQNSFWCTDTFWVTWVCYWLRPVQSVRSSLLSEECWHSPLHPLPI